MVADSVEATARRAVQWPRRAAARRRPTENMGRAMRRAATPAHTRLSGPVSMKMLARATPSPAARATPSPAGHGENCLAFNEPELHQTVGVYAERAQQGPSLAGAEVDAAGNQGGVDGTACSVVAIAVGLALGFVASVVDAVTVGIVRAVRVVREELVLMSDLLLVFLAVRTAVVVVVDEVFVHQLTSLCLAQLLLALVRVFAGQDQWQRTTFTPFQKPPRS